MAQPGSTWGDLLQNIFDDFERLDLLTQPTPVSSDLLWRYAQEAVAFFQPQIFVAGQNLLQWTSTFAYQKLYALPSDFEVDGQIAFNVSGQNVPITKVSVYQMDQMDVQVPPVIGPSEFYCMYGTAANLFAPVTDPPIVWQANFNYSGLVPSTAQQPPYLIVDDNENIQALTSINGTGVSGATHPTWATTIGTTVVDGSSVNGVVWTCWFNMSNPNGIVLRLFPTPDNVYQMTAIYQRIIPMPTLVTTSNFWTVEGEAMIRHATEGVVRKNVTHEPAEIYQRDYDQAGLEFAKLAGIVRKQSGVGKARPCYL